MWRCPYCETFNEDTANFCMICGNSKGTDAAPQESAPSTAPERPASRPRPSNMWDNGDGLGDATDLKTLAAKRAAEKYENLERDAAVRRKMYDAGEGRDISASFDAHVEASRSVVEEDNRMVVITVVLLIALLVIGFLYTKNHMADTIPPSGTPISLTQSSVVFRAGPGSDYKRQGVIEADDSFRYLGDIEEDAYGNKWCRVSHNGQIGYIRYDYVEFE